MVGIETHLEANWNCIGQKLQKCKSINTWKSLVVNKLNLVRKYSAAALEQTPCTPRWPVARISDGQWRHLTSQACMLPMLVAIHDRPITLQPTPGAIKQGSLRIGN